MMDTLNGDWNSVSTRTSLELRNIKTLIELSMSVSYFKWEEKIRLLKNAGPIGLSLMVVLSETFLQRIESEAMDTALNQFIPIEPKSYHRFVDDVHSRFENASQAMKFLEILNCQEEVIQYTIEPENEKKEINFLDINIKNTGGGKYEFAIHRKSAITNIQIKPTSSVDSKIKTGFFKGFLSRAYKICSENFIQEEISFLIDIFVQNGYDRAEMEKITNGYQPNSQQRNNIDFSKTVSMPWIPGLSNRIKKVYKKLGLRTTFKSSANLKTILCSRNKSKIGKYEKPGVYLAPCACEGKYTGETGCLCVTRINQHKNAINKGHIQDSALAEHGIKCNDNVSWDNVQVLSVQPNWYRRKVREALEIQCLQTGPEQPNGINRDLGDYVTTDTWKNFFTIWKHIEPNLKRWR